MAWAIALRNKEGEIVFDDNRCDMLFWLKRSCFSSSFHCPLRELMKNVQIDSDGDRLAPFTPFTSITANANHTEYNNVRLYDKDDHRYMFQFVENPLVFGEKDVLCSGI